MQVEIESDELQQSEAVATDQQAILELDQQPVGGTEETALEQQLTDQPLEQDEGEYMKITRVVNGVKARYLIYYTVQVCCLKRYYILNFALFICIK